jgi:hypothetical protein
MIKNDYDIQGKSIKVRNPQANAIVESVHQVIENIIQTFELENNYLDEDDPWKGILSATALQSDPPFIRVFKVLQDSLCLEEI